MSKGTFIQSDSLWIQIHLSGTGKEAYRDAADIGDQLGVSCYVLLHRQRFNPDVNNDDTFDLGMSPFFNQIMYMYM